MEEKPVEGSDSPVDELVEMTKSYLQESTFAKQNRMRMNRVNFDVYHLRQDWSHKSKGQSREFLPRQAMAVEQIVSFIQQGLVDVGDWFGVEMSPGVDESKAPIKPDEVKKLVGRALDQCEFLKTVGDAVKLALLQSLMIAKVHGKYVKKPVFYSDGGTDENGKPKDVLRKAFKEYWVPVIDLLRAEDFHIDPTANKLYEGQEIWMDMSEVFRLADAGVYKSDVADSINGGMEADYQSARKSRETAQNVTLSNYRKRVKIQEFWGNVIDRSTGRTIKENVFWTIADDRWVIRDPSENPFWHGQSPYVDCPFIRVPHSVWHKSLMDGPSQENLALNELFNLMFDAGMNDAHGIKQIRPDWLMDETQIADGIYPGISLKVNSTCPPQGKVLERVDTSTMSPEALKMFELMSSEFSASALTNDLRMGVLPNRAVKATEVVEASQSITGVFTGLAKVIEADWIQKILDLTWKNLLQHMDDMDSKEISDLLGPDRAAEIAKMSKEQRFASCAMGYKFNIYGISRILAKQKDFKKLTALLQTLASDQILAEEFMKEYDMGKLLGRIIKSLDISTDEIALSKADKDQIQSAQQAASQPDQPGGSPAAGPNTQSQIPQAGAGSTNESVESNIPRTNFGSLPGKAAGGSH